MLVAEKPDRDQQLIKVKLNPKDIANKDLVFDNKVNFSLKLKKP